MPTQAKKAHKKVGEKVLLKRWMDMVDADSEANFEILMELDNMVARMGKAIWALFFYNLVITAVIFLLLYGNQYLIK